MIVNTKFISVSSHDKPSVSASEECSPLKLAVGPFRALSSSKLIVLANLKKVLST